MPTLSPGDVVVMDNLGSHKSQAVRRLIRAAGAKLFFLPRYSPDLNPIEQVFAKLKTLLRKTDPRTIEATWRNIGDLLDRFTPQECANYLANAGYASTYRSAHCCARSRSRHCSSRGPPTPRRGLTVRLHEKGGKEHAMPCHHALAEALRTYIDAAGIAEDRKGWLFRTAPRHKADALTDRAMNQYAAWLMIRRRAKAAGITAPIGYHTFRATGITAYLANGGAIEHAQEMVAHESPRTTKLYDRTKERLTPDEVERIRL